MALTLNAAMLAAAAIMLVGGCSTNTTARVASKACCDACTLPAGQSTAISAGEADALRETLQDERLAQAFYNAVISKHGDVRPFTNIVQAEARHATLIEQLMTRHGVTIPTDAVTNVPVVPSSLAECNQYAAKLERDNIKMYDRLLVGVTEPDIRAAFENLREASRQNHLPAFERWSTSSGPAGAGQMMGVGLGRGNGRAMQGMGRGACFGFGPCITDP